MNDHIRELLYPLGFLSSLAFGIRFLLQWLNSEVERKSVVTHVFWKLSLIGNVMLLIHSLIQSQFHVCGIQACNAVISWRNLNLMEERSKQVNFSTVIKLLGSSIFSVLFLFLLQGYFIGFGNIEWFRLPGDSINAMHVSLLWHGFGAIGLLLFSFRFWVQWWYAEKEKESYLGLPFWWFSLIGGVMTLIYFVRIDDPVNSIGPAFGLIPYIRNLMIMNHQSNRTPATFS